MPTPLNRDELPGIELFDLDKPIEDQVRGILNPHYNVRSKNVTVGESTMFKLADLTSQTVPLVIASSASKATRLTRLLLEAKRLQTRVMYLIEDNAIPLVQCLGVAPDRLRLLEWPMTAETLLSEVAKECALLQPSGSKEATMNVNEAIKLARRTRFKVLGGISVTAATSIACVMPIMRFLPRGLAMPLVFCVTATAAIICFYYLFVALKHSV